MAERKPGHSKLVYDKAARTIVAVDPNPQTSETGMSATRQAQRINDLEDALRHLIKAYVSLIEAAHERITELCGSCDDVDVMEAFDPRLRQARAALNPIPA